METLQNTIPNHYENKKYLKSLTHVLSLGRFIVPSNRPVLFCFVTASLCPSAVNLLMCQILHFEYYIIFFMGFFQLLKTSLKMRKREFYCSKFFCLTKKKRIFSIKSKHKKNHDEYYMIFKISISAH